MVNFQRYRRRVPHRTACGILKTGVAPMEGEGVSGYGCESSSPRLVCLCINGLMGIPSRNQVRNRGVSV